MRQLISSWFPPVHRGVGVGWFFVCVLVPPAVLMLLAVLFVSMLFWIFASADEATARSDRLAFGRELKVVRVGMTREQLYELGFFNLTDAHGYSRPKPTLADSHPTVVASFPDVDRIICISFDARDRIANVRVTGSGRCPR